MGQDRPRGSLTSLQPQGGGAACLQPHSAHGVPLPSPARAAPILQMGKRRVREAKPLVHNKKTNKNSTTRN